MDDVLFELLPEDDYESSTGARHMAAKEALTGLWYTLRASIILSRKLDQEDATSLAAMLARDDVDLLRSRWNYHLEYAGRIYGVDVTAFAVRRIQNEAANS